MKTPLDVARNYTETKIVEITKHDIGSILIESELLNEYGEVSFYTDILIYVSLSEKQRYISNVEVILKEMYDDDGQIMPLENISEIERELAKGLDIELSEI